jgi:hypothetical protein
MIESVGGITDRAAYQEFCKSPAADARCKSPPEFSDLLAQFIRLDETGKSDPEVAESLFGSFVAAVPPPLSIGGGLRRRGLRRRCR